MGSLTFAAEGLTVRVGSNKVYSAIHQFGGVIRPKTARALVFRLAGDVVVARQVTIPARPYLGFGKADEEVVRDVLQVLLPGAR